MMKRQQNVNYPRQAREATVTKRLRRFTLIELLVVIAVIAVLLTILLPALKTAKEMARSADCKNRLRQVSLMGANYQNDYDNYLISYITNMAYTTTSFNASEFTIPPHGELIIAGYMSSKYARKGAPPWLPDSPYVCPSTKRNLDTTANISNFNTYLNAHPDLWATLNNNVRWWVGDTGSYAKHYHIYQSYMVNDRFTTVRDGIIAPKKPGELGQNLSQILFWGEFRRNNPRGRSQYYMTFGQFKKPIDGIHSFLHPHQGKGNYSALDGHVGTFTESRFYQANAAAMAGDQESSEDLLGFKW